MAAPTPTSAPRVRSPLARLFGYSADHRGRVWLASIASVLNKVLDLAPPLLIGAAVDLVTASVQGDLSSSAIAQLGYPEPATQIWILGGLTVLIWVLESLTEYAEKVWWRQLAQDLQHDFRLDAYGHVQGLELEFFEDRSTGGLMSVLNDDVNQLERFLNGGANDLLQVVTTVVTVGGIFFWIDPGVAWMAMLPMPFILWGSVIYQRKLAPRYAEVRDTVGALNGDLAGNLGGIATIKSFTSEERELDRVRQRSLEYSRANARAIVLSSAFSPLIRMVVLVGFTATMIAGGLAAIRGDIAPGSYAVMVFLTQRLLWPLTRLGETFDLYQRAMASTTRLLDLIDTPAGIVSGPERLPRDEVRGHVRFEGVDFGYSSGPPVFKGLELELRPGETTAIVGATGGGKSTLIKLLLRFYQPQGGRVTLDGHDLRELDLRDLRDAVGLVSQDVFVFHGSVAENIAYGRPDASADQLRRAAEVAEADEFVGRLAEGYDTVVGERGQKLSGGQRQRLSIARAVLKDPPILVLDEATSAVDNETEAAIQRSLERVSRGRTTLVIAHRLSTIRHADRIYVLEHGRVAEVGRHEELVEAGGSYANLWKVQTGAAVSHAV
ncbi:ABC transporter ATP-binding protein [Engelhardtia mirabilis]|uniref:Multidrug export ATP-binding/permease protein n=1 Tax=Engelhardtia mirabilis TaxID=2528011 RepID=A0A518BLG2_9BACT|nr:Putative multidrug export ATP-binding/permease protein [Planctomycetes bacterium Pla133]QDV02130.1 Putative multidrug export ATP-binding/permease protein [Planctomycetes bacterium Pla86]